MGWCLRQFCVRVGAKSGWADKLSWVVRAPDRPLQGAEKKTYTRVRRVLWDYEPLRASHAEIFIDVEGDQVRLRGRVRTLPQKLIASGIVARMPEVGDVINELIADPEVVRAVADALAQDDRTAAYVLRVDARHGVVTLRGEVASHGGPGRGHGGRFERAAGRDRPQSDHDRRSGAPRGCPAAPVEPGARV